MGQGIAQVAAQAGHPTLLYDADAAKGQGAIKAVQETWAKLAAKGKLTTDQVKHYTANLTAVADLDACRGDLIIEAIVERLDVKQQLFTQLEGINGAETLLCSNTSSLSITQIGAALAHKHRFAGLHFFNPAPLMKLVEVVTGPETSTETVETLKELMTQWGKETVTCVDAPGFIVNRVARPFYTESLRILEEGLAEPATLDGMMKAAGFRLGPCELMDLIGHDINFAVTSSLHAATFGAERFTPSRIQQQKVLAGHLGKKSGKGFYNY